MTIRLSAVLLLLIAGGCSSTPPRTVGSVNTPAVISDINMAWVQLYEDTNQTSQRVTIHYPDGPMNFDDVALDEGGSGYDNEASSVRWQIPPGWKAVLYADEDYQGEALNLVGSGTVQQISDLGSFDDEASSLRWERTP